MAVNRWNLNPVRLPVPPRSLIRIIASACGSRPAGDQASARRFRVDVQRHYSVQLRDFEQVDDPRVRRSDAHPAAGLFHRARAHYQHPQAGAVDEFEPAQIEDQFAATRFKLLPDRLLDGGELVAEH
jgi:hypothetical protein